MRTAGRTDLGMCDDELTPLLNSEHYTIQVDGRTEASQTPDAKESSTVQFALERRPSSLGGESQKRIITSKEFMQECIADIQLQIIQYIFTPTDLVALGSASKKWHKAVEESGELQRWEKMVLFLGSLKPDTTLYELKEKGYWRRKGSATYDYITELNAGISANVILSLFDNGKFSLRQLIEFHNEPSQPNSTLAIMENCLRSAQEISGSIHYQNINREFKKSAGKRPITAYLLRTIAAITLILAMIRICYLGSRVSGYDSNQSAETNILGATDHARSFSLDAMASDYNNLLLIERGYYMVTCLHLATLLQLNQTTWPTLGDKHKWPLVDLVNNICVIFSKKCANSTTGFDIVGTGNYTGLAFNCITSNQTPPAPSIPPVPPAPPYSSLAPTSTPVMNSNSSSTGALSQDIQLACLGLIGLAACIYLGGVLAKLIMTKDRKWEKKPKGTIAENERHVARKPEIELSRLLAKVDDLIELINNKIGSENYFPPQRETAHIETILTIAIKKFLKSLIRIIEANVKTIMEMHKPVKQKSELRRLEKIADYYKEHLASVIDEKVEDLKPRASLQVAFFERRFEIGQEEIKSRWEMMEQRETEARLIHH